MSQDLSRELVSTCLRLMKSPRAQPPIHLLWLLYLLSSDQSLHNFLVNQTFLHQCVDISTYEIFQKCDSRPLVKVLTPVVRILANLSAGKLYISSGATFWVISKNHDAAPTKFGIGHQLTLENASDPPLSICQSRNVKCKAWAQNEMFLDWQIDGSNF